MKFTFVAVAEEWSINDEGFEWEASYSLHSNLLAAESLRELVDEVQLKAD